MQWVDVAGAPGAGKSTLCDDLWPPRAIEWDRKPYPENWAPFLFCVERLLHSIDDHPSIGACRSMISRSFRKMATVSRLKDGRVYIQTGLAQRGLGIGWRLVHLRRDVSPIEDYYRLMPVSLGVAFVSADVATVQRRNVERGKDRAFMVPYMERPREIAVAVLKDRGVPSIELDTREPVAENVERLLAFSRRSANAADAAAARHRDQVAVPASPA